jgi:outer membrane protein OmpA-like peptidoglycan-associated protein
MKHIKIQFILILIITVALSGCTVCKRSVDLNKGTFKKKITIRSKPTKAMIYINEKQIGKTPFKTTLEYGTNRLINIKAVPIYPNQYTQNIYLNIPPVPKRMTIYMNHKPKDYSVKAVSQAMPLARHPEVTITKVDTVYIQQLKVQDKVLAPPVIYFDKDSVKLRDVDKLNTFLKMIQETPEVMVDIYGFSDVKETDGDIALSRAKATFNYLVENGVDPTRLRVFGNGGVMLSTTSKEMNDPAMNRKVMFQLYNIGNEDMVNNSEK